MNIIEQTYEITEEILTDIEAQGDLNYSLLVRSLVAEIRRLQAAAATEEPYEPFAGVYDSTIPDADDEVKPTHKYNNFGTVIKIFGRDNGFAVQWYETDATRHEQTGFNKLSAANAFLRGKGLSILTQRDFAKRSQFRR